MCLTRSNQIKTTLLQTNDTDPVRTICTGMHAERGPPSFTQYTLLRCYQTTTEQPPEPPEVVGSLEAKVGQSPIPLELSHAGEVGPGDRADVAIVHVGGERLQPHLPEVVVEEAIQFVIECSGLRPQIG